jgi:hypothetical protein
MLGRSASHRACPLQRNVLAIETSEIEIMIYATRDGVKLAYRDIGDGTDPIALVHGWACENIFLMPQPKHVSQSYRVWLSTTLSLPAAVLSWATAWVAKLRARSADDCTGRGDEFDKLRYASAEASKRAVEMSIPTARA